MVMDNGVTKDNILPVIALSDLRNPLGRVQDGSSGFYVDVVEHGEVLPSVEHVDPIFHVLKTDVGTVVDLHLAGSAFLCGNQHDTVGGSGAVDSGGRSIFQYLNQRNVVGTEGRHGAAG